jgi:hypothetical protein
MKLNAIFLISVILFSNHFFGQESLKDTIYLNDISVKKNHKKRIVKYDISGHPSYGGLTSRTSKVVCLLQDLPEGKIDNVTFYFNTGLPNLYKKKLKINYKDVLLGILICEVDEKGKPGKVISDNEIKFLVSHNHNGSLTVSLRSLNLYSQKMYFGFNVLSDVSSSENNIYISYCEDENAKLYEYGTWYNRNKEDWYSYRKDSFKLKMNIER